MTTMTEMDSAVALSGESEPLSATSDVREDELFGREQADKSKDAWNEFIDDTLIEWGRDTTVLEDEDFVPPNSEAIKSAYKIAITCRDEGCPPPTKVVPDGDGGISFERSDGTIFESINIYADLFVELIVFDDCRLTKRQQLR